jgi:S-methylmethionine-dependent homocysteine/selenocysteine methylase
MKHTDFRDLFNRAPIILGEGAVIERLRRNNELELDPFIVNSGFIYDPIKKNAISEIYRDYLDVGAEFELPIFISTATWRANRQRIADAGYAERDVNADNFHFLDELRNSYGDYAPMIIISGLLSCRGNAYNEAEALSSTEAHEFHAWQAGKLADAGVDLLLAATLPSMSEAKGLAMAMAETGLPYIVSFVVRPEGTLLDGTPLKDAIADIDAGVQPQPLAYMINCSHASFFKSALLHASNSSGKVRERITGLLANTAALTPEELDDSNALVSEDPDVFGRSVAGLREELGMKILGGCCGTDNRHIRSLASNLVG